MTTEPVDEPRSPDGPPPSTAKIAAADRNHAITADHYREQARLFGEDAASTMQDLTTRQREMEGIFQTLDWLGAHKEAPRAIVDIGCGNGLLLSLLRQGHLDIELTGLEYSPELRAIARGRDIADCEIVDGDVRALPFADSRFDVAITERCIINILDRDEQEASLREMARIVRPGGYYICIEAFTDGLAQLNEAREQMGLPHNVMPHFNRWFDPGWFRAVIEGSFDIVADPALPPTNFLSSHYFVSRVLYPASTTAPIVYNSHFARFFDFLEPIGNYSPIQFWLLRRKG